MCPRPLIDQSGAIKWIFGLICEMYNPILKYSKTLLEPSVINVHDIHAETFTAYRNYWHMLRVQIIAVFEPS